MSVGDKFYHEVYDYHAVVENYNDHTSIDVVIPETGSRLTFQAKHLRSGNFKDPYFPTIHKVGYLGDFYSPDKKVTVSKAYKVWIGMLERCYTLTEVYPAYRDAYVCKEWHHFANFKRWFDVNYKEGYVLDKDLKLLWVKYYSPETCTFLPTKVNSHFTGYRERKNDLSIGVRKLKSGWGCSYKDLNTGRRVQKSSNSKYDCCELYLKAQVGNVKWLLENYPELPEDVKLNMKYLYERKLRLLRRTRRLFPSDL